MGQHGPLGKPRGPPRVLQQGDGLMSIRHFHAQALGRFEKVLPRYDLFSVKRNGNPCTLPPGRKRLQPAQGKFQRITDTRHITDVQFELFPQSRDLGPKNIKGDEVFCAGILDLMRQLGFHIERVGHDGDRSGLHDTPECDECLREIREHDGNAISRPDPAPPERSGQFFS